MARMPGALWRPLPRSLVPMRAYEVLCRHTMVGSLWGTDGYFRSPGVGVSSHFGTGGDGTIIQWIDTAYRAGANLDGNDEVIAVENADMGPEFGPWNTGDSDAVPAYTEAQIEANAKIAAWVYQEHGIRLDPIPDSLPTRRGGGYHRLGVDPFRVPGGVRWSTSYGKGCPGPRRRAQEPQIIARARQIAAGDTEEDPLARLSDGAVALLEEIVQVYIPGRSGRTPGAGWSRIDATNRNVAALQTMVAGQNAAIQKLAEAIAAGRDDLTADELKTAVREAMAEVVKVQVSVETPDPAA